MKTEKESFSDNTYSLAKGLHHVNIAKMYFEDLQRGSSGSIKQIFNQYINKCDWIYKNIYDRVNDASREILKTEMNDSIIIESINDKLIKLGEKDRLLIEDLIDAIIKGEKIIVENTNDSQ